MGAAPYERTDERQRTAPATTGEASPPRQAGSRSRCPSSRACAVIERCKRRETSVEEAIIEMRLAGVSTRRIEDVSETLWGAGVSAGTVSNLNDKAFKAVDE